MISWVASHLAIPLGCFPDIKGKRQEEDLKHDHLDLKDPAYNLLNPINEAIVVVKTKKERSESASASSGAKSKFAAARGKIKQMGGMGGMLQIGKTIEKGPEMSKKR